MITELRFNNQIIPITNPNAIPTKTSDLLNDSDFITSSSLHNETILTSSTSRNTAAKSVNYSGFTLNTGAHIFVRFTSTVTSNPSSGNITINVNNTGAKTIVDSHINNSSIITYNKGDIFCNNKVCEFVYDGTYWVLINIDTSESGGITKTKLNSSTGSEISLSTTLQLGDIILVEGQGLTFSGNYSNRSYSFSTLIIISNSINSEYEHQVQTVIEDTNQSNRYYVGYVVITGLYSGSKKLYAYGYKCDMQNGNLNSKYSTNVSITDVYKLS